MVHAYSRVLALHVLHDNMYCLVSYTLTVRALSRGTVVELGIANGIKTEISGQLLTAAAQADICFGLGILVVGNTEG